MQRRLRDLRSSLIVELSREPIEPGLLVLLANVQTALVALDADAVDTCPKDRMRE